MDKMAVVQNRRNPRDWPGLRGIQFGGDLRVGSMRSSASPIGDVQVRRQGGGTTVKVRSHASFCSAPIGQPAKSAEGVGQGEPSAIIAQSERNGERFFNQMCRRGTKGERTSLPGTGRSSVHCRSVLTALWRTRGYNAGIGPE